MEIIELYLRQNSFNLLLWTGIFSLIIGSFLNVVVYRLPIIMQRNWRRGCAIEVFNNPGMLNDSDNQHFNLSIPGSHCPHCNHAIRAWENIPILSFLWQKARCKACQQPISWRYPLVELTTMVLSVLTAWQLGYGVGLAAGLLLTWALIALSLIDYDHQLLPDDITLPLLWLGLWLNLFGVYTQLHDAVLGAIVGYLFLWLIFWGFKLLTGKEGMGYGDFKLFAVFGAWFGWQYLLLILLLSSCVGLVFALILMATGLQQRGKAMPFGPYLAAAGWVTLLWGTDLNILLLGHAI